MAEDGAVRGEEGITHDLHRRIVRAEAEIVALSPPGQDEPAMAPQIEVLRRTGLLAACAPVESGGDGLAHLPQSPARLLEALSAVGRANLSAGRLFEGHVNAVKLIALYGEGDRKATWLTRVRNGALLGVWGAEGAKPVRLANGVLSGEKLFASGAGVLDLALVTARSELDELVLLVLDTEQLQGRLYPDEWSVSGMKATASGRCDLDGLTVAEDAVLGRPGDYLREPHFRGGVWRYAAVQLGAMQAMTVAAAAQLRARGQVTAPIQSARLRRMATACETARLWLLAAAEEVERPDAPESATARAILARLKTAEEASALIGAMDDALGAASFATFHPVERRRRDLQFYLRQADPDGMGQHALDALLDDPVLARRWSLE